MNEDSNDSLPLCFSDEATNEAQHLVYGEISITLMRPNTLECVRCKLIILMPAFVPHRNILGKFDYCE